jgi:tetratricopeptide (TPR) repeat protein
MAEAEGDKSGALAATAKLAAAAPRDLALQRKLAALRKSAGDLAGAARALEGVLALGLAAKEDLLELAALDRKLGRREQEEQVLRRLRKVDGKNRAVLERIFALHRENDPPGALEDARALLELDPQDASAHLYLADRAREEGDPAAELDELAHAAQGKGEASAAAQARADALRAELGVPKKPVSGANVNAIYLGAHTVLTRSYEKRRAARPGLRGHLELKVRVGAQGVADSVEVVRDEPADKPLTACVRATLKEAHYPVEKQTLTFKFVLAPPGKAK